MSDEGGNWVVKYCVEVGCREGVDGCGGGAEVGRVGGSRGCGSGLATT